MIKISLMKVIAQSSILVEIEILKAKLASEGIQSFIQNEFVKNREVEVIYRGLIIDEKEVLVENLKDKFP